jgi:hypothetical protein
MNMLDRLRISLKRNEAIRTNRVAVGKMKLVYVLVADKRLRYANGRSRIAYIGTTRKGAERIAQSVAARAEAIFKLRGVRSFDARIVTCNPRQNVETWKKLERGLLLCFRERFDEVPKCNSKGKRMRPRDEFDLFAKKRLMNVINELS